MSKVFLTSVDLNKNELQNARLQNLATAPATPVVGQMYYNTTTNAAYVWNGTLWSVFDARLATQIPLSALVTDPLARSNHTGTQTAATISNFDTQVRTTRLDQMAAPTAAVGMNSQKITGLAQPTTGGDAAEYQWTLNQIQASSAGLDVKNSVRGLKLISTLAAAPTGLAAFEGITPITGERYLVLDASFTPNVFNGIWTASAGTWTRASDCDTATEYTSGTFTFVEEGSTYGGTQWKVSTTGAFVIGTTAINWVQFGGTNTYVAGNGMTLTGQTLAVGGGTGIVVSADEIAIDTTIVVRKYAVNVGDGTATSIAVTHNLGTLDVTVGVYTVVGGAEVECDIVHTSTNVITLTFATAPAANQYRAVVHG